MEKYIHLPPSHPIYTFQSYEVHFYELHFVAAHLYLSILEGYIFSIDLKILLKYEQFCILWYGESSLWNDALASPGRQLSLNANFGKTSLLNHYSWYISRIYVNISILLSLEIFSLCVGGGGGGIIRSPDSIMIITVSLYFTGLEYQLQSARRELCWWHHSPSNKQKTHNNKTTNNISCNNNNPKKETVKQVSHQKVIYDSKSTCISSRRT